METILEFLTQPNIIFAKIIQLISIFFQVDISCKILIYFFKYKTHIKNIILYFILLFIGNIFICIKVPILYSSFLSLLLGTLILKFIFKIDLILALIANISLMPIIITIKTILCKILSPNLDYYNTIIIPINSIILFIASYSILYLILFILKKLNIGLNELKPLTKTQKILFIINLLLYLEATYVQIFLMDFYEQNITFFIIIFNFIGINSYYLITVYFCILSNSLLIYKEDLETQQLYNKTLEKLYDNLREFKHDFNNIIQSLGGYITLKDYKGLEEYYNKLLEETKNTTNLSFLSPDIINNPAINNLITNKYFKAKELNINMDLEILLNLNSLNISTYDLSRILGILLDNAIEAASKCPPNEKNIIIQMQNDKKNKRKLIIIKNTYTNKDINIDLIFDKGYTSKKSDLKSHGLGLPKVRNIISSYSNLNLFTTKNDKYFIQQLEIYNKNKTK